MQTFLPYADFERSAEVLDQRRLGKQIMECAQLIRALHVPGAGYTNHPVTVMWRGHTAALYLYQWTCWQEWHNVRGYKDHQSLHTAAAVIEEYVPSVFRQREHDADFYPAWLGNKKLHKQYKSILVQKNPDYYRQFFPNVRDDLVLEYPEGREA